MKIGFIQQANSADKHQNILRLSEGIADLARRGAELIVLQELHNSLYFCQVEDVANFDLAEPIFPDKSLDDETDVRRLTETVMSSIEAQIRANPGQWFWYNKRWVLDPLTV